MTNEQIETLRAKIDKLVNCEKRASYHFVKNDDAKFYNEACDDSIKARRDLETYMESLKDE